MRRLTRRGKSPQEPRDFTLEVPKFVTMPLVDRLIERAQPLLQGTTRFRKLIVDTRELTHISPVGLTALASIVLLAVRNRRFESGVLQPPKKKHVRTYLSRMNFNRLLRVQEPRRARAHRAPRRGRFRELVEIGDEYDCVRVTEQLRDVVKKQAPLKDVVLNNMVHCLLEVMENVIHHAGSPTNGLACGQAYPGSRAVELAIVDCGIGIQASLRKNPQYRERINSDEDAVRLAVKKGVTSTPSRNTGEGLFFVAELLARSGKMKVHSGEAVLTTSPQGMVVTPASNWPGTLVGLRFELKRTVPIREVFDKYAPQIEELESFPLEEVTERE